MEPIYVTDLGKSFRLFPPGAFRNDNKWSWYIVGPRGSQQRVTAGTNDLDQAKRVVHNLARGLPPEEARDAAREEMAKLLPPSREEIARLTGLLTVELRRLSDERERYQTTMSVIRAIVDAA